jgi:hypothetical protein
MQTVEETARLIDETARETKSHEARQRMAELVIKLGYVSQESKRLWADYLAKGCPAL